MTVPNPRFVFTYFTHNFDNGVPIVPRHIWEGQDPKTFANFDLAQGWPVVSGPYRLAHSVPEQRIWDRRDGWWAAKIGFRQPPQVERLIYLPYMEEAKQVQNLAINAMDLCADMLPPNIRTVLEQNSNADDLEWPRAALWLSRLVAPLAGFQCPRAALRRAGLPLGRKPRHQPRAA